MQKDFGFLVTHVFLNFVILKIYQNERIYFEILTWKVDQLQWKCFCNFLDFYKLFLRLKSFFYVFGLHVHVLKQKNMKIWKNNFKYAQLFKISFVALRPEIPSKIFFCPMFVRFKQIWELSRLGKCDQKVTKFCKRLQ